MSVTEENVIGFMETVKIFFFKKNFFFGRKKL